MKTIDLTGQVFGRWTVIERGKNSACGQAQWACRCVCGGTKTLTGAVLRRGLSQSCGCLKLEQLAKRSTKHGHSHQGGCSPTYHSWSGMIARCSNPTHDAYYRYGARGISVCARWHDFGNFLADMGEKPSGHSIDRINSDRDYEPGNCRWATPKEQARNKSNNALITANGKTATIAEWAENTGIHAMTLSYRLSKGWPHEKIIGTPPRRSAKSPPPGQNLS